MLHKCSTDCAKGLQTGNDLQGHSRSLTMVSFDRPHNYDFLLVFHWKYVSILYRFRDITLTCPKFKTVTWLSILPDFNGQRARAVPQRQLVFLFGDDFGLLSKFFDLLFICSYRPLTFWTFEYQRWHTVVTGSSRPVSRPYYISAAQWKLLPILTKSEVFNPQRRGLVHVN